jgi:hypothetical protein
VAATDPVVKVIEHQLAFDLRASWQARVLEASGGHLGAVVLSVLAHNFDEAMPTLLRVVFPGFTSISAPYYCSAAKVDKAGRIVADVVTTYGRIAKDQKVFDDETQMRDAFRMLADRIKLSDADRIELFKCAQRGWSPTAGSIRPLTRKTPTLNGWCTDGGRGHPYATDVQAGWRARTSATARLRSWPASSGSLRRRFRNARRSRVIARRLRS